MDAEGLKELLQGNSQNSQDRAVNIAIRTIMDSGQQLSTDEDMEIDLNQQIKLDINLVEEEPLQFNCEDIEEEQKAQSSSKTPSVFFTQILQEGDLDRKNQQPNQFDVGPSFQENEKQRKQPTQDDKLKQYLLESLEMSKIHAKFRNQKRNQQDLIEDGQLEAIEGITDKNQKQIDEPKSLPPQRVSKGYRQRRKGDQSLESDEIFESEEQKQRRQRRAGGRQPSTSEETFYSRKPQLQKMIREMQQYNDLLTKQKNQKEQEPLQISSSTNMTSEELLAGLTNSNQNLSQSSMEHAHLSASAPVFVPHQPVMHVATQNPGDMQSTSLNYDSSSSAHRSEVLYSEHYSREKMEELIKVGKLFKSRIRYNVGDRTEAYVKLERCEVDVLVKNPKHQNRSLDGDEVVFEVLPLKYWWKQKSRRVAGNSSSSSISSMHQQNTTSQLAGSSLQMDQNGWQMQDDTWCAFGSPPQDNNVDFHNQNFLTSPSHNAESAIHDDLWSSPQAMQTQGQLSKQMDDMYLEEGKVSSKPWNVDSKYQSVSGSQQEGMEDDLWTSFQKQVQPLNQNQSVARNYNLMEGQWGSLDRNLVDDALQRQKGYLDEHVQTDNFKKDQDKNKQDGRKFDRECGTLDLSKELLVSEQFLKSQQLQQVSQSANAHLTGSSQNPVQIQPSMLKNMLKNVLPKSNNTQNLKSNTSIQKVEFQSSSSSNHFQSQQINQENVDSGVQKQNNQVEIKSLLSQIQDNYNDQVQERKDQDYVLKNQVQQSVDNLLEDLLPNVQEDQQQKISTDQISISAQQNQSKSQIEDSQNIQNSDIFKMIQPKVSNDQQQLKQINLNQNQQSQQQANQSEMQIVQEGDKTQKNISDSQNTDLTNQSQVQEQIKIDFLISKLMSPSVQKNNSVPQNIQKDDSSSSLHLLANQIKNISNQFNSEEEKSSVGHLGDETQRDWWPKSYDEKIPLPLFLPLPLESDMSSQDEADNSHDEHVQNAQNAQDVQNNIGDDDGDIFREFKKKVQEFEKKQRKKIQKNKRKQQKLYSEKDWLKPENPETALQAISQFIEINHDLRPSAKVVGIWRHAPKRQAIIGTVRAEGWGQLRIFPIDEKLPSCVLQEDELPQELSEQIKNEAEQKNNKSLLKGELVEWESNEENPKIKIVSSLGMAGDIETETRALLEMEGIYYTDQFSPEVLKCLPDQSQQLISSEEIQKRRDFRNIRVFTIDPATARDLDDALSIQTLENGNFQIGVHIADVSHFVQSKTALDEEAQFRSTSIYLVQRVIPMLPRLLCEELCSLNPGIDRFSFSILWEMNQEGRILKEWVGRSVICSCVKLSYEMAQNMLEDTFDVDSYEDPPKVHCGYNWGDIIHDVKKLNFIAKKLRGRRFDDGAVRIDNVKIWFELDENGDPIESGVQERRDSNKLIEEYMLLANMRVAQFISESFPDFSLLRRHPPPNKTKLMELEQLAITMGFQMDTSTSRTLHRSFMKLRQICQSKYDSTIYEMLQLLFTKPMNLAEYFSTGEYEYQSQWRHYALSVDRYTHFTSPIRRYPDVVVHRLLQAAIDLRIRQNNNNNTTEIDISNPQGAGFQQDFYGDINSIPLNDTANSYDNNNNQEVQCMDTDMQHVVQHHKLQTSKDLTLTCVHCNDRKYSSKQIQEANQRIYLCAMLRNHPVITEAVVIDVKGDRFFEVYVPRYGCITRITVKMHAYVTSRWLGSQKAIELMHGQQGNGGDSESGVELEQEEFLDSSFEIEKADNSEQLQKLQLPCQLQMLTKIPVYLTATQAGGEKVSSLLAFIYC